MIRQYHAHRRQGGDNLFGVGIIAAGTIVYLQNDSWWRDRGKPVCREPFIVEAFLNGTMGAARRNRDTGLWEDAFISRRSDLAVVRSLRDGRHRHVAVRALILHDDEGLTVPGGYPSLPNPRFYCASRRCHGSDMPLLQLATG